MHTTCRFSYSNILCVSKSKYLNLTMIIIIGFFRLIRILYKVMNNIILFAILFQQKVLISHYKLF